MIDRLLNLSSRLTHTKCNEGKLSLKQMIKVNESLLDSVLPCKEEHNELSLRNVGESNPMEESDRITMSDLQSILSTAKYDSSDKDTRSPSGNEKAVIIQKILQQIFMDESNQEEVQKCFSILISNDPHHHQQRQQEEASILMVVQYLLRLSFLKSQQTTTKSLVENTLNNILFVAYPLLLSTPSYSAELRDAIIDTSFTYLNDNDDRNDRIDDERNRESNGDINDSLTSCLNLIQQSISIILQTRIADVRNNDSNITPELIVTIVEFSCRILTRILTLVKNERSYNINKTNTTENEIQTVLETLHQVAISILTSLCYFSNKSSTDGGNGGPLLMNGRTSTLLRIVTSLLLPCLIESSLLQGHIKDENNYDDDNRYTSHFNECMLSLWDFIHDLMCSDENDESPSKRKCRSW